jgi:hypothetical protein
LAPAAGWRETQSPALLRAAFAGISGVAYVIVARGRRWNARRNGPGIVAVNGNLESTRGDFLSVHKARGQGWLILIAEDDEVNRKVIRRQMPVDRPDTRPAELRDHPTQAV